LDEAIEIGKRFGTDNSPNFINGVLDQVAHSGCVKLQ
jgi:transcription termination factor NusB